MTCEVCLYNEATESRTGDGVVQLHPLNVGFSTALSFDYLQTEFSFNGVPRVCVMSLIF